MVHERSLSVVRANKIDIEQDFRVIKIATEQTTEAAMKSKAPTSGHVVNNLAIALLNLPLR